jgi:hypothetical protein
MNFRVSCLPAERLSSSRWEFCLAASCRSPYEGRKNYKDDVTDMMIWLLGFEHWSTSHISILRKHVPRPGFFTNSQIYFIVKDIRFCCKSQISFSLLLSAQCDVIFKRFSLLQLLAFFTWNTLKDVTPVIYEPSNCIYDLIRLYFIVLITRLYK